MKIILGFIPLLDCASLVVAAERGFAMEEDIELALVRETSWANIRDRVVVGHFDAAHMLGPMTVASTLGYGFITATNEEEALALAREYEPDLVLADAWMPGLDGRKLVRQLKDDPATAQSKAVVMTGRCPESAWRQEVLPQFKVDDCIAKPLTVGDLIAMVKKHIPQEVQAISPATG